MADRHDPTLLIDAELEAALRDLAGSLAVPTTAAVERAQDPARRARFRIEEAGRRARPGRRWTWLAPTPGRRLGRGLVLAVVAVAVAAAVVGAMGLGLPGIRIVFAPSPSATAPAPAATGSIRPTARPTPSPAPTVASPLGSDLGLGDPVALTDIHSAVDIPVRLPRTPGGAGPATAWIRDGRLSLVWASGPGLPSTGEPGVGLVLGEFRGSLEPGYFEKVIGQGTTVETIRIGDLTGYWISGAPHEIVYVDANGQPVFDSRRSVGDTLLWARGDVTYRLEAGLDRARAIALAESLP